MKDQEMGGINLDNLGGPSLITVALLSKAAVAAKSLQLCPTLCDPRDGSPPGSSIHGIFQARVLEWGAIAFFSRSQKRKEV